MADPAGIRAGEACGVRRHAAVAAKFVVAACRLAGSSVRYVAGGKIYLFTMSTPIMNSELSIDNYLTLLIVSCEIFIALYS